MAAFEPYLEKFNELQPDFVKKVQENHVIVDVLKTAAEKGAMNFIKILVKDLDDMECLISLKSSHEVAL